MCHTERQIFRRKQQLSSNRYRKVVVDLSYLTVIKVNNLKKNKQKITFGRKNMYEIEFSFIFNSTVSTLH